MHFIVITYTLFPFKFSNNSLRGYLLNISFDDVSSSFLPLFLAPIAQTSWHSLVNKLLRKRSRDCELCVFTFCQEIRKPRNNRKQIRGGTNWAKVSIYFCSITWLNMNRMLMNVTQGNVGEDEFSTSTENLRKYIFSRAGETFLD